MRFLSFGRVLVIVAFLWYFGFIFQYYYIGDHVSALIDNYALANPDRFRKDLKGNWFFLYDECSLSDVYINLSWVRFMDRVTFQPLISTDLRLNICLSLIEARKKLKGSELDFLLSNCGMSIEQFAARYRIGVSLVRTWIDRDTPIASEIDQRFCFRFMNEMLGWEGNADEITRIIDVRNAKKKYDWKKPIWVRQVNPN